MPDNGVAMGWRIQTKTLNFFNNMIHVVKHMLSYTVTLKEKSHFNMFD